LVHHPFISIHDRPQVTEGRCGCGGSTKSFLNRLGGSLRACDLLAHACLPRLPDPQHRLFEEPHVAWRRLQLGKFVCEHGRTVLVGLEWRALARALRESGEPRNLAVRDAFAFRQARRMLYPASVEDERGQEITEGLAAYTGTVLAAQSAADAIVGAVDLLDGAATTALEASFVRTFAYVSGPAYGLLLDASSPGWTRRVRGTDDLATLVMRALAVQPATDATASTTRYGGAEIRASEERREQERQERLGELRRRFVDGPVLVIPGGGSGMSDSRGAAVIPGIGTVYFGPFRSSGDWGTLEAEKGVLVASDGRSRRVAAPVRRDEVTFTGDGWTFKARPGWVVREGSRRGDYEAVRQQP
jgi:hypothetical protein